ncbi:MAG: tetratricopeptide repeat protein [Flavobacteriales bacterium]|nr:tetratricopeptide repeat protein [Flavobacteriales bacterium]
MHAQDASVIPGELKLLQDPINDTDRARTYNWICFNYAYENPDAGIKFGWMGLELSKKLDFRKGIGDAHSNMGFCFTCKSEFDSAAIHYENAIAAFKRADNPCWTKVPLSNLGANYFKQKELAKALEYYLEAARLEEGCEDRGFKSTSIYSVGIVYNAMELYDKAMPYFEQSYNIDVANGDSAKMAEKLTAMGNALTGLNQIDEARSKFMSSFALYARLNESYRKGTAHHGMAKLEEKSGNMPAAIEQAEKAKLIFKQEERTSDWMSTCILLSGFYIRSGEWQKANEVLTEGLKLAEALQVKSDRLKIYEDLALVNMKTGKADEALNYFEKFNALRDTLASEELNDKLAEYATRYETEKKEKDLVIEKEKNAVQEAEIRFQQFQKRILMVMGGVFLLLALVLVNRYRLKIRIARELEEKNKLIEREKELAKEGERFRQKFLAHMSHEIRTPVSSISGLAELLRRSDLGDKEERYVSAIHQSSLSLVSVVNDVLDLAKIEAGKIELESTPFDLKAEMETLVDSFRPLADKKGVKLCVTIDEKLAGAYSGDARRIKQVLYNLISNALKFTERGEVKLMISLVNTAGIHGQQLHFVVRDTGKGMTVAELHRIFDDYFQSASGHGGTGLGLGIAKSLIALMGGNLEVSSVPERGSEFSFILTLKPASILKPAPAAWNRASHDGLLRALDGKCVLITDDIANNRLLASESLQAWLPGLQVREAASGEEAISIVRQGGVALVLMDLHMDEMNGITCVEKIREFSTIPVIALTASTDLAEHEAAVKAGMQAVVLKPYSERELTTAMASVFGIADSFEVQEASASPDKWSYVYQLADNDIDRVKKYLSMAIRELGPLLVQIKSAMVNNEPGLFRASAHRGITYIACIDRATALNQARAFAGMDDAMLMNLRQQIHGWLLEIEEGMAEAEQYLKQLK